MRVAVGSAMAFLAAEIEIFDGAVSAFWGPLLVAAWALGVFLLARWSWNVTHRALCWSRSVVCGWRAWRQNCDDPTSEAQRETQMKTDGEADGETDGAAAPDENNEQRATSNAARATSDNATTSLREEDAADYEKNDTASSVCDPIAKPGTAVSVHYDPTY